MSDQLEEKRKAEFDIQIAHLTEIHQGFIDNSAKVASFILLALGWFATSQDARTFLASTAHITSYAALAVIAAYLLSVAASWIAYRLSGKAFRRLNELAYLPKSAYEGRLLGPTTFGVCTAGNGVLAAILVAAILTASP